MAATASPPNSKSCPIHLFHQIIHKVWMVALATKTKAPPYAISRVLSERWQKNWCSMAIQYAEIQ